MHTQEGEAGIGHWIDEAANESLALGRQLVVFAAERHDAQPMGAAHHAGDRVALQPSAIDERPGVNFLARCLQDKPIRCLRNANHFGIESNLATVFCDNLGIFEGHSHVIHDPGIWRPKPLDPSGVGLVFGDSLSGDFGQSGYAIGSTATVQLFQPGQFLFACGDHHLATQFVREFVLLAESHHPPGAFDDHLCFETAWFVVEASMDHAAVVAGLVGCHRALFFQTTRRRSGRRVARSMAVANPTIPAPTIAMSNLASVTMSPPHRSEPWCALAKPIIFEFIWCICRLYHTCGRLSNSRCRGI